ncbi:unnamed protein product [Vicia faba]|uniref:C3H1-type domain-containing protein n=1 Tax=Vicia faba TaxID=3906 RepID=A0AAV0YVS4_VICFA|nr:unnamed protein product [Vicia faba]
MPYSNNIPTFKMPPPQFSLSTSSDIIQVSPQLPMTNQHTALDRSHSFKRLRMSDNNHSNTVMGPPPNRPTGNIFFKTCICTRFCFGTCRNGENCTFAHGAHEIRQPPPNWQELVGLHTQEWLQLGGNSNDDQKIIHKMKLYKRYYNGQECPYGDNYNFLHQDPTEFRDDSWNTRESSAISSAISIRTCNHLEGNRVGTKPVRGTNWNTKICLKWINTGCCTSKFALSFHQYFLTTRLLALLTQIRV